MITDEPLVENTGIYVAVETQVAYHEQVPYRGNGIDILYIDCKGCR